MLQIEDGTLNDSTTAILPFRQAVTANLTHFLEPVPVYFRLKPDVDEYIIEWDWAGTLESRKVVILKDGVEVHVELAADKLGEIPEDALSVASKLRNPLKYPIGCPMITAELLATTEKTGEKWLKNGRVAFIDGLRDGTIPRNCTTKPFKSTKRGLC